MLKDAHGLCSFFLAFAVALFFPTISALSAGQPHIEIFGGSSAANGSYFAWAGGVYAPKSGLYDPGWRMRAMSGHGRYGYKSGGGNIIFGRVTTFEITPGYQIVKKPLIVKIYAGPHFERHELESPDPGNKVQGDKLGFKAIVESWLDLGPRAYMSADISGSTIYGAWSACAKVGWRIKQFISAGPEISTNGNNNHKEWRTGLFSRAEFGRFAANLSGGYARLYKGKGHGYAALSFDVKF